MRASDREEDTQATQSTAPGTMDQNKAKALVSGFGKRQCGSACRFDQLALLSIKTLGDCLALYNHDYRLLCLR